MAKEVSAGMAARFLGVTPKTISNWRRKGKLKAVRELPTSDNRITYMYSIDDVRRIADERNSVVSTASQA